jgi:pilin isopeptide linkage protein
MKMRSKTRRTVVAGVFAAVLAVVALVLTGCDATSVNDVESADIATLQSYVDKLQKKNPLDMSAAEVNKLGDTLGIDKIGDQTVSELARQSLFFSHTFDNRMDFKISDDQTWTYTVSLTKDGAALAGSYPLVIMDENYQILEVKTVANGDTLTMPVESRNFAILGVGYGATALFQPEALAHFNYPEKASEEFKGTTPSSNAGTLGGMNIVRSTVLKNKVYVSEYASLSSTTDAATSDLPVLVTTAQFPSDLTEYKVLYARYLVERDFVNYETNPYQLNVHQNNGLVTNDNNWSYLYLTGTTMTAANPTSNPMAMLTSGLLVKDTGSYRYVISDRNTNSYIVSASKEVYEFTFDAVRDSDTGEIVIENKQLTKIRDANGQECNIPVTDNTCLFTEPEGCNGAPLTLSGYVCAYDSEDNERYTLDETFDITLTPNDDASKAAMPDGVDSITVQTDKSGLYKIEGLDFADCEGYGPFTFTLTCTSGTDKNLTYDTKTRRITVNTKRDTDGTLAIVSVTEQVYPSGVSQFISGDTTPSNDPLQDPRAFTALMPKLTKTSIQFDKTIENGDAAAGAYSFKITYADDATRLAIISSKISITGAPMVTSGAGSACYPLALTVKSPALKDGVAATMTSTEFTFKKAGIYSFYVDEVVGDDSDMTYDTHRALVTFDVAADGNGNLVATRIDNGTSFVNTAKLPETTISVVVPGHDDWNEEFHTYTAEDETGAEVPVTIDENGDVTFDKTYTSKETGEHVVTVTDDRGNKVKVTITVTVDDNGEVQAEYTINPTDGFEGWDCPEPITPTIVVPGHDDWNEETHTYTVYDKDGNKVESSIADGDVVFTKTYTEDDLGKTHTYTVVDDLGNEVTVAVEVSLDEDTNTIVTKTTIDPEDGFESMDCPRTATPTIVVPGHDDWNEETHTYTVTDEDGAEIPCRIVDGDVEFKQEYTDEDLGKHEYTVTDDLGNEVHVTVEVAVNIKTGELVTIVTMDPDDGFESMDCPEPAEPEPGKTDAKVVVPGHDDWNEETHTYVVTDENGDEVPSKVEDGDVVFTKTYTEDDKGTHEYTVTDDLGQEVHVTVTVDVDEDGNVTVSYELDPADGFEGMDCPEPVVPDEPLPGGDVEVDVPTDDKNVDDDTADDAKQPATDDKTADDTKQPAADTDDTKAADTVTPVTKPAAATKAATAKTADATAVSQMAGMAAGGAALLGGAWLGLKGRKRK